MIKNNSRGVITQNQADQVVVAVTENLPANDQGVYINSNKVIELFALPDTFVFTYENSNENGDVAKTAYIFNEDLYEVTPTTNTAGTPVKTYSDGYTGKNYNALLGSANGGRGVKFSGFNISFDDASGNENGSAFATANLTLLAYNGSGSSIPVPINLSRAERNTALNTGLLTIRQAFWLNRTNQIKITNPKGNTMVFTGFVSETQN
jgi:hypothetical protein